MKTFHCDDCGEAGRDKELLHTGWDSYAYLCHDEEKSCYNHVVMLGIPWA